jgi:hypothetical protein
MAGRKRIDPVSRPADGFRPWDRITNRDPNRHYVLTNPNDEETGTSYYVGMLGYEVEHQRPGGPKAAVGRSFKEGEAVTSGGQILVSCPIEEKNARDQQGWAYADAMDRRILRDGNVEDGLRGRGLSMGVDREQTSAPFEERNGA